MCNAVLSTSNREAPICVVCRGDFEGQEEQWTHEGGQGHDPFHKNCFQAWLRVNPICPYDEILIDPSTIISRTDRIFEKTKQVLVNSTRAAFVGAVAVPVVAVAEAALVAVAAVAVAAEAERVGIAVAPTVAVVAAVAAAAVAAEAEGGVGRAVAVAAVAAVAAAAAAVIRGLCDHLEMTENDQINISIGLCLGGLGMVMMVLTSGSDFFPTALAIVPLACGIFSGVATLRR